MMAREFWIADTERYQCMDCGSLICGEDPADSKGYEGNTLHVIEFSEYEKMKKVCSELIQQLNDLTNWGIRTHEMPGYSELLMDSRDLVIRAKSIMKECDDPTPYCNACGAKKKENCKCGPIADNE